MLTDLLNSSYFALFLIVALGFMLGKMKINSTWSFGGQNGDKQLQKLML